MDSTLSALLRAAARADRLSKPSALEEEVVDLFDQFRDRLIRYALSFGLSIEDGEEIVQEVFLALFQHLQQGKPRQNLRGWVFRVTHNLALRQRGQSRRNPQIGPYDAALPVDPAPGPEDQLAINEREERLQKALRALPELDQRCRRHLKPPIGAGGSKRHGESPEFATAGDQRRSESSAVSGRTLTPCVALRRWA